MYSTYNLLTVSQGGGDVQNISANIFEFAIAALVKDMFINIDKNAHKHHTVKKFRIHHETRIRRQSFC